MYVCLSVSVWVCERVCVYAHTSYRNIQLYGENVPALNKYLTEENIFNNETTMEKDP